MAFDEGYDPKTGTQGTARVGIADLAERIDLPAGSVPIIGRDDEVNPEEYMRGFTDGREAGLRHNISIVSADSGNVRIEALRAAATVMAGIVASSRPFENVGNAGTSANELTLGMAEQFAAWLETGNR